MIPPYGVRHRGVCLFVDSIKATARKAQGCASDNPNATDALLHRSSNLKGTYSKSPRRVPWALLVNRNYIETLTRSL